MLRGVLAIVVGYVVMAIAIVAIFSVMFQGIGQDRAFEPGSYTVTWFWLVPAIIVSVVAAMIGGYVCARISPGRAPQILAVVVLLLGIGLALPALQPLNDPRPRLRPAGISNLEAMSNAHQPAPITLLNPLIGLFGVLAGAKLAKK